MDNEQYQMIVNNIRDAIDESGLKQRAVAERCGMDPKQLNNILCFRKRLNADDIPKLCNALGVLPDRFFKETITPQPA